MPGVSIPLYQSGAGHRADIAITMGMVHHDTRRIKEAMMYCIYLRDEDLLKPEHFPAAALLNEAGNSDVVEFVENLARGVGSGYDFSVCTFWNDLDEYEQAHTPAFDGLWVTNEGGEELFISLPDLVHYLEILYLRMSDTHFPDLLKFRQALDKFGTQARAGTAGGTEGPLRPDM